MILPVLYSKKIFIVNNKTDYEIYQFIDQLDLGNYDYNLVATVDGNDPFQMTFYRDRVWRGGSLPPEIFSTKLTATFIYKEGKTFIQGIIKTNPTYYIFYFFGSLSLFYNLFARTDKTGSFIVYFIAFIFFFSVDIYSKQKVKKAFEKILSDLDKKILN